MMQAYLTCSRTQRTAKREVIDAMALEAEVGGPIKSHIAEVFFGDSSSRIPSLFAKIE